MIYVSIDIETSGLDHEKHKVLSIGAIIEDTEKKLPYEECPKFNAIVLQNEIIGSPRAIRTWPMPQWRIFYRLRMDCDPTGKIKLRLISRIGLERSKSDGRKLQGRKKPDVSLKRDKR